MNNYSDCLCEVNFRLNADRDREEERTCNENKERRQALSMNVGMVGIVCKQFIFNQTLLLLCGFEPRVQ